MQKHHGSFIACLVIALVTQLRVSKLNPDVEKSIKEKLKTNINFGQIMHILNNFTLFDTYKVKSYLGLDGENSSFQVIKSDVIYAAKVVIDTDDEYQKCKKQKLIKDLNDKKLPYLNIVKEYQEYNYKELNTIFYSCVVISELGVTDITEVDLFSFGGLDSQIKNSKIFFRFFGKAVLAFAELHFKGKILHGNINPKNIMIKYKKKHSNFDPYIINFGFMLENKEEKDISDEQFRYTLTYRPPEMYLGQKVNSEKEEKTFIETWSKKWGNYKFSKNFAEDVYALGQTIKYCLKRHSNYISETKCETRGLKEISDEMIKERYESLADGSTKPLRPNMKQVLGMFVKVTKKCNKGIDDNFHKKFIILVEESLASMSKNILII